MPARVMWRADIDAALSGQYDLKWHYSEILNAQDVFRKLVEEGFGESKRRRSRAIRNYVKRQYDEDKVVKFKQAGLQSTNLLNLFVDVECSFPPQQALTRKRRARLARFMRSAIRRRASLISNPPEGARMRSSWDFTEDAAPFTQAGYPALPAGSVLLDPGSAECFPRVVIEGGPGQGKSTLAQYISQVHRMRILEKNRLLERLPPDHVSAPVRVPFKVDLRDLALWVDGFYPSRTGVKARHEQSETLETFLAAQVANAAGGETFDASDLHAVFQALPTCIIFDGFDEIATAKQRRRVIGEIESGLERLSEDALSGQVIVTSRPNAMPNSPAFDRSRWTYISLNSISSALALKYASQWSAARKLDRRESVELLAILEEKIQVPHLSQLAKNPMQLTILLSLIQLRGRSLPDQRTTMYENYIDVFFNRESEKTQVVRENRDLLIGLHGFLAWKMHADAERSGTDGRLSQEEIKTLIAEWLAHLGHKKGAVDTLFTGVVQRVVAIVSRVEGYFEFEVQPLREYFAARHLYHSAPYSPPGETVSGTKPEILAALVASPYWTNVLRFYAGFYSSGEAPGLADELVGRIESADAKSAMYFRSLAVSLLGDWVLHQQPKWTDRLAKVAIDGRLVRASFEMRWPDSGNVLTLPSSCGGEYLVDLSMSLLQSASIGNVRMDLRELILRNATPSDLVRRWVADIEAAPTGDSAQSSRLWRLGKELRLFSGLDTEAFGVAERYFAREVSPETRYRALSLDERINTSSESLTSYRALLAGELEPGEDLLFRELHHLTRIELVRMLVSHAGVSFNDLFPELPTLEILSARIPELHGLSDALEKTRRRSPGDFQNALEPWQVYISGIVGAEDNSFLAHLLAVNSSRIVASGEKGNGASSLFDSTAFVTERARYARMRGGSAAWWATQLASATSEAQRGIWAMHMLAWGNRATLSGFLVDLREIVERMHPGNISLLAGLIPWSSTRRSSSGQGGGGPVLSAGGLRLNFLLSLRGFAENREYVRKQPRFGEGALTPEIAAYLADDLLTNWRGGARPSAVMWRSLHRDYVELSGISQGQYLMWWGASWDVDPSRMPIELARRIIEDPIEMPTALLAGADARLGMLPQSLDVVRPLGQIAEEEGWMCDIR